MSTGPDPNPTDPLPPGTIENCGEGSLCCPVDCNKPDVYLMICNSHQIQIPLDGSTVSLAADDYFYVYKQPLPGPIAIGAKVESVNSLGDGLYEYTIRGFGMIGGGPIDSGTVATYDFNCRDDHTYQVGIVDQLTFASGGITDPVDGRVQIVVTTQPNNPSHHFRQKCCKVSTLNIDGPITDPNHNRDTASTLTKDLGSIANANQTLTCEMTIKKSDDGRVVIKYNNYIFKLVDIDAEPPDLTAQDGEYEVFTWIPIAQGGNWPGPGVDEKFILKVQLQDNVCPSMTSATITRAIEFSIRGGLNKRYFDLVEVE